MNNNYDRGAGEGPRYTMSSFNKDLTPLVDISDSETECEPNVTMFLLLDGTTIISEYKETITGDSYILDNPLLVIIESTAMVDGNYSSSVSYDIWLPLSKDRIFTIPKSRIITKTQPLDSLVDTYFEHKNNG